MLFCEINGVARDSDCVVSFFPVGTPPIILIPYVVLLQEKQEQQNRLQGLSSQHRASFGAVKSSLNQPKSPTPRVLHQAWGVEGHSDVVQSALQNGSLESQYPSSFFHPFLSGNQFVGVPFIKWFDGHGDFKGRVVRFLPCTTEHTGQQNISGLPEPSAVGSQKSNSKGISESQMAQKTSRDAVDGDSHEVQDIYRVEYDDSSFQ